jgi:hypothetical protein
MDTMSMPKTSGFKGIIQARCSLSAYPKAHPVQEETGNMIATFIFEDILCQWGALEEIVTDNRSPFVKALDILGEKYKIFNIWISAYNSRANSIIECQHRLVWKLIMKAADGVESKWPLVFHSVMWAERITIQKSTRYSPYQIAHGTELLFPFDLAKATYLAPPLNTAKPVRMRQTIAYDPHDPRVSKDMMILPVDTPPKYPGPWPLRMSATKAELVNRLSVVSIFFLSSLLSCLGLTRLTSAAQSGLQTVRGAGARMSQPYQTVLQRVSAQQGQVPICSTSWSRCAEDEYG